MGPFEGMFDWPMLKYIPGWDQRAGAVDPFDDVRALLARITADGVRLFRKRWQVLRALAVLRL